MLGKQADVSHAEDTVETISENLKELDTEFHAEIAKIQSEMSSENLDLESLSVQPRKADINVEKVVLAWLPWYTAADGSLQPAS